MDLPVKLRNASRNYKYLIDSTSKAEDIVNKVESDIKSKLVTNTNNEIEYYDIPAYSEAWNTKKSETGNFKSIYMLSEL